MAQSSCESRSGRAVNLVKHTLLFVASNDFFVEGETSDYFLSHNYAEPNGESRDREIEYEK